LHPFHPMKNTLCAAALAAAAALGIVSAAHLRMQDGPIHIVSKDMVTSHSLVAAKHNISDALCSQEGGASNITQAQRSVKQTTKLRVCNAVTTDREALLSVWHNDQVLGTKLIEQRKCVEFIVPVAANNKFNVKLTGLVSADWSAEKSGSEMNDIPIMFLVAHVYGEGDGTTFSVDEFHGEHNGLKSVQVAYMDIFRGAPDARLQLISPHGEFELRGGTFISVCAGKYKLRFIQDGKILGEDTSATHFEVGDQYIVLRTSPEKRQDGGIAAETAIVFPQADGPEHSWWWPR